MGWEKVFDREAPSLLDLFSASSSGAPGGVGATSDSTHLGDNHKPVAMSTGQLARQRSASSGSRLPIRAATPIDTRTTDLEFEPCAATASIFLFAQGSSILCLHHDTLAIDRRFEAHKEQILFLSVDNVSERGAGRLVVSYDTGQTAIVWDLFNGDELARFASYEPIRVSAWMKNGNVAFGMCAWNLFRRRQLM